jgi:hypothetical protein
LIGCPESIKEQVMEDAMKRAPRRTSETRELSDKELSQITSAMGDSVRLQSINVTSIIQANLKAEFAAHSKKASALIKMRKSVAA